MHESKDLSLLLANTRRGSEKEVGNEGQEMQSSNWQETGETEMFRNLESVIFAAEEAQIDRIHLRNLNVSWIPVKQVLEIECRV